VIHDRLENAPLYRILHPRLALAFDFLCTARLAELPSGKQTVDGENVFALVNDYSTQPLDQCRFEAHRRYTDIQYMVSGIERIGVTNVAAVRVTEPHVVERDIAFFAGQGDLLTLSEGTFALFFPHDAHQPGIAVGSPQRVRKIVMKVALQD
jgi:YhcH/YjgK/YiaL family protein